MSTRKHDRFTSIIEEYMGEFLRETAIADGTRVVSVTGVRVNSQETIAEVSVSMYPPVPKEDAVAALALLSRDAVHFLAKRARFRQLPKIHFVPDRGFEAAAHIDDILREGE